MVQTIGSLDFILPVKSIIALINLLFIFSLRLKTLSN